MTKDWKERLGVVYSTNPDFTYDNGEGEIAETVPPEKQVLRVVLDRKNRRGKTVTLVLGFRGTAGDIKEIGKMLRNKCGAGGAESDGEILIQGDFKDKITSILTAKGYKVKA